MVWVKYDYEALATADYPLHAGTCVDLLHGNLEWAAMENACDICVGPAMNISAATYFESGALLSSTWSELGTRFPVWPRQKANDGSPRTITVSLLWALSGSGTATVRVYVAGSRASLVVADDDANYIEDVLASTSYDWKDFEVTLPEIGIPLGADEHPDDLLGSLPPPVDESQIVVVATCTTPSRYLRVQAVRIQEGAP